MQLIEKILNRRLRWYLESNELLNPNQYGFQRHRFTIDVLTNMESNICNAFLNRKYLAAVYLDIEKDFNRIWKFKIVSSLLELKVNSTILYS